MLTTKKYIMPITIAPYSAVAPEVEITGAAKKPSVNTNR